MLNLKTILKIVRKMNEKMTFFAILLSLNYRKKFPFAEQTWSTCAITLQIIILENLTRCSTIDQFHCLKKSFLS